MKSEEIKALMKRAKTEEKQNPEFLYQLGLRFKNGEGADVDMYRADKYFAKACKMGHGMAALEHGLFWWKTVKSYYYAEIFLKKAGELGASEAEELLAEMKNEEAEKKAAKAKPADDGMIHCTAKGGADLHEIPKFRDNAYISFCKEHTFLCCPACRGKIREKNRIVSGELTERVVTVFDKGSIFERRTDPYDAPTSEGQTVTATYACDACGLSFDMTARKRYEVREKEESVKDMLLARDSGTEWWTLMEISYQADPARVGKDVIKVLKKSEGKFEGRS